MENPKILRITVEAKATLPLDALEPFQGDLKHLEKDEYEKLRESLKEHGFSFCVHVWCHDGHNYIIDGHQRVFVAKQMRDVEGYIIPEIPVAFVMATTYGEAKEKVLAGASQYGTVDEASVVRYLKENSIDFAKAQSRFHFQEIEFADIADQFSVVSSSPEPETSPDHEEKTLKSGSDQVKQLQLYFMLADYSEFISKIEDLKKYYAKENVTDTLVELVREKHTTVKPAAQ